jgi:hypothetical protein
VYLWRTLRFHERHGVLFPDTPQILFKLLLASIIRGICDYCDGMKNDLWQACAAVAAASYGRAIISRIPITAHLSNTHLQT